MINFTQLITETLPTILRKAILEAYLQCVVKQVSRVYDLFLAYRDKTYLFLAYSSRVADLQMLLNNVFEPEYELIWIETTASKPTILYKKIDYSTNRVFYMRSEFDNQILSASPTYLHLKSEGITTLNSFVVHVPEFIADKNDQIRSLVNQYKLAGKTFEIRNFFA